MKTCFKCGEAKPKREFYRHPMMADGRLGKCKECTKRDVREHRRANSERVRAYDRERSLRPDRKAKKVERERAWARKNRIKKRAHLTVHRAIVRGALKRRPCENCGAKTVHAHHDDYTKPLEVRWLCPLCHQRHHSPYG